MKMYIYYFFTHISADNLYNIVGYLGSEVTFATFIGYRSDQKNLLVKTIVPKYGVPSKNKSVFCVGYGRVDDITFFDVQVHFIFVI